MLPRSHSSKRAKQIQKILFLNNSCSSATSASTGFLEKTAVLLTEIAFCFPREEKAYESSRINKKG